MVHTPEINPQLLSWARETAGLSVDEAAEKLGLKSSKKATAAEKLLELEMGARAISNGLLQKAVAAYRRPLVTFYLPQPPARGERGEDFRAVSGGIAPRENAALDALTRDVRARQQMLREVLTDVDEVRTLAFVAGCKIGQGATAVAASIRTTLGVTLGEQQRARDPIKLFALLRAAAERAGIYVLLLGDLGSHHSDIGDDVFRGFAIADDVAPFVVINDNDAAAARAFTLIHELAHIWIGASGISGPLGGAAENAIERFCNRVAGEFLLPTDALSHLNDFRGADTERALQLTAEVARIWHVSQSAVTYRMLANGLISDGVATTLFRLFRERWQAEKQNAKQTRDLEDDGPSYYIVRRSRLGAAIIDVVRRALQDDTLTHTKAAQILGVKPTAVNQLLSERPRAT